MSPDLSHRSNLLELMDDPAVEYDEFAQTLQQLETINHLTGAYRPTLSVVSYFYEIFHKKSKEPLRVLDVGCGYGDTLRQIARWGAKNNIRFKLTGLDLSPHAQRAAFQVDSPIPIEYLTQDIFLFNPEEKYHLIINSLFTHHLNDGDIRRVVDWMLENSEYGWFINDLHRHWLPYYFIKYFVRAFRFNRLIRNDAPLSVARGFRREEWQDILQQSKADFKKLLIQWYWPFRFGVRYVH